MDFIYSMTDTFFYDFIYSLGRELFIKVRITFCNYIKIYLFKQTLQYGNCCIFYFFYLTQLFVLYVLLLGFGYGFFFIRMRWVFLTLVTTDIFMLNFLTTFS